MNKVLIIAEAGVNHNGDVDKARMLIDVAKDAGADVVKFQTFKSEKEICAFTEKAPYQITTTDETESFLEMVKKLELSESAHKDLYEYCAKKEIKFLSTPFETDSIEFLDKLGLDVFKVSSGQITNLPFLRKIGQLGKNIILSTGMSTLEEVRSALNVLYEQGIMEEQIILLHCTTAYPTEVDDVNLSAMLTMKREFGLEVGYSDHTLGTEVAIAAVALGARLIEKHFTLSRTMEGPDHQASLEPDELESMVRGIRQIERALGDGIKKPTESELENILLARRSIVASKDIKEGEVFSEENITVKSPAGGISPMEWDSVIGGTAVRNFREDSFIEI